MSEDARIDPRTVATLYWQSNALTTRLDLIHTRLDLIQTRLDLIQTLVFYTLVLHANHEFTQVFCFPEFSVGILKPE